MSSSSTAPSQPSPTPSSSSPRGSSSQRHDHHDHHHPPPNTSTSSLHPLLPPLPQPTTLAAEVDPYADYRAQQAQAKKVSAIPEKCFTFCSQRSDGQPLCRMFCLRKRQMMNTQAEDLARLRPPPRRHLDTASASVISSSTGPSSTATSSSSGLLSGWSPFEALRRRLDPYSFIYVRGSPDGVVGRYMEEMEYDDGQYDFGTASRGAQDIVKRRRGENQLEWLDWEDHGSMLYLPLTSLFHPILSIPNTLDRIFAPTRAFFAAYRDSFTDGAQLRSLNRLQEEAVNGGAFQLLGKVRERWAKAALEAQEKRREELEKMRKVGKEMDGKEVD